MPKYARHWNVSSRVEHQNKRSQRVSTKLSNLCESKSVSNTTTTYTKLECPVRSNQLRKNMLLVPKHFC
jgi:hypothetical protein